MSIPAFLIGMAVLGSAPPAPIASIDCPDDAALFSTKLLALRGDAHSAELAHSHAVKLCNDESEAVLFASIYSIMSENQEWVAGIQLANSRTDPRRELAIAFLIAAASKGNESVYVTLADLILDYSSESAFQHAGAYWLRMNFICGQSASIPRSMRLVEKHGLTDLVDLGDEQVWDFYAHHPRGFDQASESTISKHPALLALFKEHQDAVASGKCE